MHSDSLEKLLELQRRIRAALRAKMVAQTPDALSRRARDDRGDTIFAIDVAAEDVLLPFCEEWSKRTSLTLVAEGIEPEGGLVLGRPGSSGPELRVIVDPIDGTRGLMFDKRSAWTLAAVAPEKGPDTRMSDITCAAMTELPTTRQGYADCLWAVRGGGAQGWREGVLDGSRRELEVLPSRHDDLLHGFATVASYFQGGKELLGRLAEDILGAERGGWNPDKAEVYTDQYICTGGALAELALGRDRFLLDVRALVHRVLGVRSSLCCRPYDLCTALVAQAAGCVVVAPDGGPLDAPLDVTSNVAFAAYANPALAARLAPIVVAALRRHGLL